MLTAVLVADGDTSHLSPHNPPTAATVHPAGAPPSAAVVAHLSRSQLAGQRIVYSYAGPTPPRSLLTLIRAGEAAGVVLFSDNVRSVAQVRAAVAELQDADAASAVHAPLLVMTDQEGGLVRRLPGGPELSEREIGERSDAVAQAATAGAQAARALMRAGANVNLAPVVDVYRRAGGFIDQFERSYGSSATRVAELSSAFIAAQQHAGVAATAKHFPGLGAAGREQDTDTGPVTLDVPPLALRNVDELPFRAAIRAGVRLVMVSWAVYPTLDANLPAGLSPRVIEGELRGRLGFGGVTITDSLGVGALASYGSLADRGARAAGAGADLLLCAATNPSEDSPAIGVSVLRGLRDSIAAGSISLHAARASAARVLALRSA